MSALLYTIIPVAAVLLGALVTLWRPPSARTRSLVQHLAAGVVFSAAAVEILPDVLNAGAFWPSLIGALLGMAAMALLQVAEGRMKGANGLIITATADVFIDGLVLGLGFLQGAKQGLMLTIALTLELLFLGLSVVSNLGQASKARALRVTLLLALALPLGALAGLQLGELPPALLSGFYAFSLIALLYLVVEELLVEAHETPDTPLMPTAFFTGFIALMFLEQLL